ncbi:ArsR/SmtB family transcription factor [Promicromonospora iranensis]|uniref:DNA-binding transcriptional ArsR family regulator n=1 Tax=Promicromonospora iranensis TaxID=1105144 RepID=A0ABU2CTH8_9MICO|nr:metalloregulator ArsR/SmtB family transcription factor [Promicromonospora iranensis]MDR7384627.1 DNA-binding transcriptional ArsR family regulator [Promicromonospora iranensis]
MDVFAALADPVRRDLLLRLAAGPARVVDMASAHPISRPAISKHLRALGSAGLVVADDVGRERHYRLDRAGLAPVSALLAELAPAPPAPAPPIAEQAFDGLELEVRRVGRDRRAAPSAQHFESEHNDEETA